MKNTIKEVVVKTIEKDDDPWRTLDLFFAEGSQVNAQMWSSGNAVIVYRITTADLWKVAAACLKAIGEEADEVPES